jgi:hypothetical protein
VSATFFLVSQDGGTGFNFLARDIAFAAESRHLQSRGDIRQGRGSLMASDVANPALSKDSVATIAVVVRRLPEGQDAGRGNRPSPELALELLSENGEPSDRARTKFVFTFQ